MTLNCKEHMRGTQVCFNFALLFLAAALAVVEALPLGTPFFKSAFLVLWYTFAYNRSYSEDL